MRVAVVVRSLKIGGMERASINLAEAFSNYGCETHLIYLRNKKRAFTPDKNVFIHNFNLDKALNMTIVGYILKMFSKFLNGIFRGTYFLYIGLLFTPIFKFKLKKLENEYGKFDLIIMRGHGTYELIWAYKDDRVVQMVESVSNKTGSYLNNIYIKCLYADKHLAGVSSGVKEEIENALRLTSVKAKSINIVNNSIDINDILKKSNAYNINVESGYIVSVGRIVANKNISFLIDSYYYAKKSLGLKTPLVLVGNGNEIKNIKLQIKKLDLESNIIILGLLENPFPWIKNASVLTLTSFAEGFGMVLIEALACKTKIISTKSKGGVYDIMFDELESYLVDFNVEAFGKKMYETINEKKELNFDKYTQKFEASSIVKRYIELYIH